MAALIYLDTHVVLWLYGGRTDLLPAGVRDLLRQQDLLISPMVVLEMQYLFELQRTSEPASTVLAALSREIGLAVCDLPFSEVAQEALRQDWTRDPFDRLIVSQAALRGAPLLTKDQAIRDHYPQAVWGE
jgi:PIN domain nuclease of toxin-antitoxin system